MKDKQANIDFKKQGEARLEIFAAKIETGAGRRIRNFFVAIILFQAFFAGSILRFDSMRQLDGRSADEGVYTSFADRIAREGVPGARSLIQNYNANESKWCYPPPYRIGYLAPVVFVMQLAGNTNLETGVISSFIFSIVSLFLLLMFGLRFFNWPITALALFLASISPIDLALAQRFWQDGMMACMGMLLVFLSCGIIRNSKKTSWIVFFVCVGSYGLLIKESAVVVYGLCILWISTMLIVKEKAFKKVAVLVVSSVLGMMISAGILSWVAGGLSVVREAIGHTRGAMDVASYGIRCCSGPWFQILWGFWIMVPFSTIFCVVAIVSVFFKKKRELVQGRREVVFFLIFIMVTYIGFISILPNLKNMRYMGVISGPFYLLSACGVWEIILFLRAKLRDSFFYVAMIIFALCLMVFALAEYQRFWDLVVKSRINDLAIVSMDRVYHGFPALL